MQELARRWVVGGIVIGSVFGCRSAETRPADGTNASASGPSGMAGVEPCRDRAQRLRLGEVEREVPIVDPMRLENVARLNGCVVGIKAGGVYASRGSCTKMLCPALPAGNRERCCNTCEGEGLAVGGTVPIELMKGGKLLSCARGLDCELMKRCDIRPGYYDLLGRLNVLDPSHVRLDVESMQPVDPPGPPPPVRRLEAPCFASQNTSGSDDWFLHFRAEYGGLVALLKDDGRTVRELRRVEASFGFGGMELEICEGLLAVWLPGLRCSASASFVEALGKVAPVVRTECLPPMTREELASACKTGAIPQARCATTEPR
jgi:hypothetical protein